jgi:hypothetical protein
MSLTKLLNPCSKLAPLVCRALRRAAGLVSGLLVGASASIRLSTRNSMVWADSQSRPASSTTWRADFDEAR